ncbi:MAG: hypothetical protein E7J35_05360 [Veillonella sp.]|uniref:hypothetical protein n=1 Tax=Veillonella sp. TaxID=1926307 RepID=UPI0029108D2F|nr:hypothetical protein [Veillonella sp.]MDU7927965.1 hypothetical protein [Veillonella sp.]MDU7955019.1 hypothetical protein [Clostridium perfringens]MDU7962766.1 hypothetical protein [Clostridium perfringens]
MNYLFWNTNKKKINNILKDIIIENNCDIVALAEYEDDIKSLINSLDKENIDMYEFQMIVCNRITLLTKFKPMFIERFSDNSHYVILKIPHKSIKYHLVAFVHLPSKLNANCTDLLFRIHNLITNLEKDEIKCKCNNSIILGDFNLNPFEIPMIAAGSAHALSCKRVASRGKRTINDTDYKMFYNPMWNLFGDNEGVPGTYYYSDSGQDVYFWNIFDQVIIRPELINFFESESLKVILNAKETSLLNKNGKPNKDISDHLPIFFTIN